MCVINLAQFNLTLRVINPNFPLTKTTTTPLKTISTHLCACCTSYVRRRRRVYMQIGIITLSCHRRGDEDEDDIIRSILARNVVSEMRCAYTNIYRCCSSALPGLLLYTSDVSSYISLVPPHTKPFPPFP